MQSPRGEAAEGKRGRGHRQQYGEGEARAFAAASSAGATPRWSKGPRRSAKSVEAERQLTQWPCPSSERTCRERRRGQRLKGAATHASATHASAAAAWAHQLALIRRPNLDGPVLRARVQEPLAAPAQAGDRVGVPAERAGAPPAHALPQPDRPVLGGGGEPTLGQSRSDLGPSPSGGCGALGEVWAGRLQPAAPAEWYGSHARALTHFLCASMTCGRRGAKHSRREGGCVGGRRGECVGRGARGGVGRGR